MTFEQVVETWTCPYCVLWGQTRAGDVEGTNLAAHLRVVGCKADYDARQRVEPR